MSTSPWTFNGNVLASRINVLIHSDHLPQCEVLNGFASQVLLRSIHGYTASQMFLTGRVQSCMSLAKLNSFQWCTLWCCVMHSFYMKTNDKPSCTCLHYIFNTYYCVLIAQLNMGVFHLIVFNNIMTVMTDDFHRSFYECFEIFSLGRQ